MKLNKKIKKAFKKSNLYYTRGTGITPKRVTSGGAHPRVLALGQHNSETSQRCRAIGDSVFDLIDRGTEAQTSRTGSIV